MERGLIRRRSLMVWLSLSILLLAISSGAVARRFAGGAERFWTFLAAAAAQLGIVGQIASLLGAFTPAGVLAVQAVIAGLMFVALRAVPDPAGSRPTAAALLARARCTFGGASVPTLALALASVVLVALSCIDRALVLVGDIDDLNYHAARAAYWVQHASLFPFDTHNERQTAFPYLAEQVFAWGILFTKSEFVGKMLFWLAVPLAAVGSYTVARAAGAGRAAAASASLLLLATPATLRLGVMLKPDLWAAVPVLGVAYWAITALGAPDARRRWAMAGVYFALAVAVKTTMLALLPGLLALALAGQTRASLVRAAASLLAGAFVGALASGVLLLSVWNAVVYEHPLGPAQIRRLVQPKLEPRTVYVHLGRLPVHLLELPEVPNEPARRAIERFGAALARSLGADRKLPGEGRGWPGAFHYTHAHQAQRYSTGGLLWLPVLLAASVGALVAAVRTFPRVRIPAPEALAVLQVPLFLGVVFLIRWMGGGPERFWFPAYALAVPLIAAVVGGWAAASRLVAVVAAVLLAWTAAAAARAEAFRLTAPQGRIARDAHGGAMLQAAAVIEEPARILLFGAQSSREYLLFDPERGFKNAVFPWGKEEFDPDRMERLIREHNLTHVYFEHDRGLGFMTAPSLRTPPAIDWLRALPGTTEIPLPPPSRLFRLHAAGEAQDGPVAPPTAGPDAGKM